MKLKCSSNWFYSAKKIILTTLQFSNDSLCQRQLMWLKIGILKIPWFWFCLCAKDKFKDDLKLNPFHFSHFNTNAFTFSIKKIFLKDISFSKDININVTLNRYRKKEKFNLHGITLKIIFPSKTNLYVRQEMNSTMIKQKKKIKSTLNWINDIAVLNVLWIIF